MLKLSEIVAEVDALVPNPFNDAQKVGWLNEINKEFFEFVKIPVIHQFVTTAGQNDYVLPSGVKSNNIDRVQVNQTFYNSMQYQDIIPGHNYWILDDATKILSLNPYPSLSHLLGVVKYAKTATTTFVSSNLTTTPDAPEEYHFTYVLGLCERVAKGMNDVTLANNYGADYRNQIAIAQQNFGNRVQEG